MELIIRPIFRRRNVVKPVTTVNQSQILSTLPIAPKRRACGKLKMANSTPTNDYN